MSDLEEAAHAALQEVRTLRERVGQARDACHEASGYVTKLAERTDADLKALHDAVAELDQTVEEDSQHLVGEMTSAEPALADIVNASHQAGTEGQQTLQTEAAALDELTQHLKDLGPQITALAETAETASRNALFRASEIADGLDHLVIEVEQLLSIELAAVIADMTREVEATTAAVLKVLVDAPLAAQEMDQDFNHKFEEVRLHMDEFWPALTQHADEVEAYCVEKLGHLMNEAMGEIEGQAQAVQGELTTVTHLATEKDAELARLAQEVSGHQQGCVDDAKRAGDAFHEVLGRWALFGFV